MNLEKISGSERVLKEFAFDKYLNYLLKERRYGSFLKEGLLKFYEYFEEGFSVIKDNFYLLGL